MFVSDLHLHCLKKAFPSDKFASRFRKVLKGKKWISCFWLLSTQRWKGFQLGAPEGAALFLLFLGKQNPAPLGICVTCQDFLCFLLQCMKRGEEKPIIKWESVCQGKAESEYSTSLKIDLWYPSARALPFLLAKSYPFEFCVGDQAETSMAPSTVPGGAAWGKYGILLLSPS